MDDAAGTPRRGRDALPVCGAGGAGKTRGAGVRAARLVPYLAVIGEREAAGGLAAVPVRDGRRAGTLPVGELVRRIGERAAARGSRLWDADVPA
ncbi:hypothetical protein [Streptomyces sp. NBC_00704]|uniref:hypothetical protein n=1 Tax=Streptomyces sp. NBC_00704 TaxID=2975809 RepID=UPI003FA75F20